MSNPSLDIYVLFRASKKTGNVDTVMTGMGNALMRMWALNNTPKTKITFIFNRETGDCEYAFCGQANNMPLAKDGKLGTCEQLLGITLDELQDIKDDRFD